MVETRSRSASRARVAAVSASGAGVMSGFCGFGWERVSTAAVCGSVAGVFGSGMAVSSVATGSVGWVLVRVAASLAGVSVLSLIGMAPVVVGCTSRRWRTQS